MATFQHYVRSECGRSGVAISGVARSNASQFIVLNGISQSYRIQSIYHLTPEEYWALYSAVSGVARSGMARSNNPILYPRTAHIQQSYTVNNAFRWSISQEYRLQNFLYKVLQLSYVIHRGVRRAIQQEYVVRNINDGVLFAKAFPVQQYRITNYVTKSINQQYLIFNWIHKILAQEYSVVDSIKKGISQEYIIQESFVVAVQQEYSIAPGFVQAIQQEYTVFNGKMITTKNRKSISNESGWF